MSVITITISIDVPDGARVNVSSGAAAKARPNTSARGARGSGEAIPPGGSDRKMPGKKGGTIGETETESLQWWETKIAEGLRDDPHSKYAQKNEEDLEAIRGELARRQGGGSFSDGSPPGDAPQDFSHNGGSDDDIPFAPWTLP